MSVPRHPSRRRFHRSAALVSVACGLSIAVPTQSWATTPATSWGHRQVIDRGAHLSAVSCASDTLCAAVDFGARALLYDGDGWSAPQSLQGQGKLVDVSCATESMCLTSTASGRVYRFDGAHWVHQGKVAGASHVSALSCAGPSFCVLVDHGDHAFTYQSGAWSRPVDLGFAPGSGGAYDVSCASPSFCVVSGLTGEVVAYREGRWGRPKQADSDEDTFATSISCASRQMCVLTDDDGNAVMFNGHQWTTRRVFRRGPMIAASCPTARFCGAVAAYDRALVYRATWRHAKPLHDSKQLQGISCTRDRFCVAIDLFGGAVLRQPG